MMPTRARTAWISLFLTVAVGCKFSMREPELAPPSAYVKAAVDELGKGNFDAAEEILDRARERFWSDELVLRWSAELYLMRWNDEAAHDLLTELTRAERLTSVSRSELKGQIGDLLFRLGKYGESAQYLRAGQDGVAEKQRRAKAFITLGLPYVRRELEYATADMELFDGIWPAVVCRLGHQDHVCVLDTGTSMTALSASVAQEVGVSDMRDLGLVSDSLGRRHEARIGILPGLGLGRMGLGPMPVLILSDERMALRDTSGGPDHPPMGIIGLDVLSRFRLVLDMSKRRARLEAPQDLVARAVLPCLAAEGCLILPVNVDGVTMWFILDTAASHSSLTKRGLADLPGGARRATPDYRALNSLGGAFLSQKVTGVVVQTSAVKFTGIEFPVVDRTNFGTFPVHGVLGVDLLQHCRMTLDGGRILLEQVSSRPPKSRDER